jgi:hypothetical protein
VYFVYDKVENVRTSCTNKEVLSYTDLRYCNKIRPYVHGRSSPITTVIEPVTSAIEIETNRIMIRHFRSHDWFTSDRTEMSPLSCRFISTKTNATKIPRGDVEGLHPHCLPDPCID